MYYYFIYIFPYVPKTEYECDTGSQTIEYDGMIGVVSNYVFYDD